MGRVSGLVGCCLLGWIVAQCTSADEPADRDGFVFGVNVHSDSPNYRDVPIETQLALVTELGAEWLRWDWIQPALSEDLSFYDQWVEMAAEKGVKLMVAGRLNGAEMSRTEWYRKGRIPLHTLRAQISYACGLARTIYGAIGVKVWIYTGDVIPHKKIEGAE